jgi:NADH-quinone oxidoreductase subunit H
VAEIINSKFLSWISGVEIPADYWVGFAFAALLHCVFLIQVPAAGALFFIWLERKVAGRIQDRLGPTRVGGKFGWLQTLADGIKLIAKEDITPGAADPFLFKFAPYISFACSFAALFALPFASGWVGQYLNHAVFFIVAVLGLEVFGVILAGYASGSKWSLFGGMREAAQVVSYEVPVGLCVLIPVMIAGSMNLTTIGDMQRGLFTNWFIFHDPFTFFIIFAVFFTCAMASVNRAPFDLAEAESELVAGFHTEYSGLRWSIFFMAEYGSMFIVSALAAILFLGGWHGPIPIGEPIAQAIASALAILPMVNETWIAGYLTNLLGCLNLIFKTSLGVTFMIWVRWTLPRLRIDQVITMCWKYCVPLAAIGFLGLLFWQYFELWSPNNIAPNNRIAVREHWNVAPQAKANESQDASATNSATNGATTGHHRHRRQVVLGDKTASRPTGPKPAAEPKPATEQVSGAPQRKSRGGA